MNEVIERCNWLVDKCNDKAITPDVKNDFRYLLEEIERLNNIIKEVREYINNSGGMELVNNYSFPEKPIIDKLAKTDLLEILDKVSK